MDEKEQKLLADFISAIRTFEKRPHHLFWRQFLLGICYGLGATVGLAIVITLFGYILHLLGGLPIVGNWLGTLAKSLRDSYR